MKTPDFPMLKHEKSATAGRMMRVLLCVCCAVMISGCTQNHSDLMADIKKIKDKPPGRIPPLPEFDNYESFVYNAIDRRDPFVAYVEPTPVASGGKKNTLRPPENHVPEALEAFPLDGLEFVGLMENKRETWALIKAPDNIIHRVKVGNRLGQNYGKVTAVAEAKVDLVEIVEDGLGGWMKRDAAIALSE